MDITAEFQVTEYDESQKKEWDSFINNSYSGDILQFWGWGESKKEQGWKPLRLAVSQIVCAFANN